MRGACLALFALAGLGTACGTTLDVERARRWIRLPEAPAAPALTGAESGTLPAVRGLLAVSGELRRVPLRWLPALGGDVGGYAVERGELREGPFAPIALVPGRSSTVYVDDGPARWPAGRGDPGPPADGAGREARDALRDGETLFYRVRAVSDAGLLAAAPSAVAAASTAPAPDPPADVRAYSHQPRQVPLSWSPSPERHVDGYVVERSPSSRGPFEPLATVQGRYQSVHLDAQLGDLRVFYYRVRSVNAAGGRGEPSEPVRAVTKAEPLPPVGLRVTGQRLGANAVAWDANVEVDLREYRLLRLRDGASRPELVTSLPPDTNRAVDPLVVADERVAYTLVAVDRDGLESAQAQPLAVTSAGYELSATAGREGVRLRWNPRTREGYRGARIYLHGPLGRRELGFAAQPPFLHAEAEPGRRHRYSVVLEREDASRAPPSSPLEVEVPRR